MPNAAHQYYISPSGVDIYIWDESTLICLVKLNALRIIECKFVLYMRSCGIS